MCYKRPAAHGTPEAKSLTDNNLLTDVTSLRPIHIHYSASEFRAGPRVPTSPVPVLAGSKVNELGAGTITEYIISFPGQAMSGLKAIGREPGRLDYIACDLEISGYPSFSAEFNYISRSM